MSTYCLHAVVSKSNNPTGNNSENAIISARSELFYSAIKTKEHVFIIYTLEALLLEARPLLIATLLFIAFDTPKVHYQEKSFIKNVWNEIRIVIKVENYVKLFTQNL